MKMFMQPSKWIEEIILHEHHNVMYEIAADKTVALLHHFNVQTIYSFDNGQVSVIEFHNITEHYTLYNELIWIWTNMDYLRFTQVGSVVSVIKIHEPS